MILSLLLTSLPAFADLITWPLTESDPYRNCKNTGFRSYIAAGEKGWVSSILPGFGSSPEYYYFNGTEFITDRICEYEGREWLTISVIRYPQPGNEDFESSLIGEMVPLEDVVPAYDAETFTEDHAGEIQAREDAFDICGLVPFTVMRYPDSPVRLYEIAAKDECYALTGNNALSPMRSRYTDPDGDRWELISDDTVFQKGWVNVDHPQGFAEQYGKLYVSIVPDSDELADLLNASGAVN